MLPIPTKNSAALACPLSGAFRSNADYHSTVYFGLCQVSFALFKNAS
jgi:hypothetical protein